MLEIEKIKIRFPSNEIGVKNFYDSCERSHRFVFDRKENFTYHMGKAKHDLKAAFDDLNSKNWDWVVVKSYYAIHHAGNALLLNKKSFYSKDHICLIVALKKLNLVSQELFNKLKNVHERFGNFIGLALTFEIRKIGQYDVIKWKEIEEEDAKKLIEFAKQFVSFVEESV